MKDITKHWLDFAHADLKNCGKILDDPTLTHIVAFHSQQAVEESFKALLEENDVEIPRIHNLVRLHQIFSEYSDISIDKEKLMVLDSVYTTSRYPTELGLFYSGKPTIAEATIIYNFAYKIWEMVNKELQIQ